MPNRFIVNKIPIDEFLELAITLPVIDVRSPSEFNYGHIPGAINIPLFDDREREIVGTSYKKQGRETAILKGLELTGPSMHRKLREAISAARENKLLVHCWRGGMRSEAMAWLFSLGGIDCKVLDGGYKSYRNHILAGLSARKRSVILGGMTGSGKSYIIRRISEMGQQIIDLERLANHKGSSFGALGEDPQPSSEHFSNLLFSQWSCINESQPVWLEDESKNIGTVFMPDNFYFNMQDSPTVVLLMDMEKRIPRLVKEYSEYPPELLVQAVNRISKRLGGDNTREALRAIEAGDFARAIEITLIYYDKAYMYGISRKKKENLIYVTADTDDVEVNARKVLEASKAITW